MVLSNKKLKQKLRAAKAELFIASNEEKRLAPKNSKSSQDLDSKTSHYLGIVNPLAEKLRLSKREKRSQKPKEEKPGVIKNGEISGDAGAMEQDESKAEAVEVKKKKKKKKRKSDENGDEEAMEQDGSRAEAVEVKKKKKKKRKRDGNGDEEAMEQDGSRAEAVEVKKKKKKRRDESEASENVKEQRLKQPKKKKKAKKKKKNKKKVENGKVKEEGAKQNGNGATSEEQLVAKRDESIDRKTLEISAKVYVGGIPYYSTEDDIRSYFEGCGTITSIDCMTFPDTGKFRGIALITFKTDAAAKRALALDGSDMGGLFLKIQPFKTVRANNKLPNFSPTVVKGYNRIYIGNLSWDVTEDDLRKLFSNCTISSIRFGEDKQTGEFKGYAHVDFADSLSLNTALKLDQTLVCDRPVRISCAVPKKGTTPTELNPVSNDDEIVAAKSKPMPENDQVGGGSISVDDGSQTVSGEANAGSAKIRRRTCYECGEKGHLSSACPKKQAADSVAKDDEIIIAAKSKPMPENYQVWVGSVSVVDGSQTVSGEANASSAKIRRQTCYECGEKGHLSSACPKKQSTESIAKDDEIIIAAKSIPMPENDQVGVGSVSVVDGSQIAIVETTASSAKIRRRTCYECGEKGHLSSACPKKQATDLENPGAA